MVIRILISVFVGFVVIQLLAILLQRRLTYFPPRVSLKATLHEAEKANVSLWGSPKNPFGLMTTQPSSTGSLVYYHGNADYMLTQLYQFHWLMNAFPHTTHAFFEYPGYSEFPGTPSEQLITDHGLKALQSLKGPTILVGHSIGAAVAAQLAAQLPVKGLILISPFTSLETMARHHYPYLLSRYFLRESWNSLKNLSQLNVPLLIIHGEQDSIIPFRFGKELYDAYTGPKTLIPLPRINHNDIPLHNKELQKHIVKFIQDTFSR